VGVGAEDGDRVSPGPWLEPSTSRAEGSCERLIQAGHDPARRRETWHTFAKTAVQPTG